VIHQISRRWQLSTTPTSNAHLSQAKATLLNNTFQIMFLSNWPRAAITVLFLIVSTTLRQQGTLAMSTTKNIVVVGGGIQGTSVAYFLAKNSDANTKITLLEAKAPASAASGKGGGFMARGWGDGSPTQRLHELAFDMYEELANELNIQSYRKLPVLSVSPGYDGIGAAKKSAALGEIVPNWLDGKVGRISALGYGDDTAQVTPAEVVDKMIQATSDKVQVVLGTCCGVETDQGSERGARKIVGVKYQPRTDSNSGEYAEEQLLPADAMVVSAGPWSCAGEDWFQGAVDLPMEGVKSTSIVWKQPEGQTVDATALFCGEDNRYGTHLEVYPRPDGTIYICGIGGSDYITKEELKDGAFREVCEANERRVDAASQSFQEMSSLYKQVGELDRVQACMRPCPPDAMPYMGAVPGFEGAFINAGHNCWGIAWAPACGKAISELVLDGECTSVNLRPFDPSRFTPKTTQRGGRGRKKKGTSVGEQW
jgi:glycine/D-amino acid oxidase-like deaminating enzyme